LGLGTFGFNWEGFNNTSGL